MPTLLRWLLRAALATLCLAAAVLALCLVAVLWSDPRFAAPLSPTPEELAAAGIDFSQPYTVTPRRFALADGTELQAATFPAAGSATTVLFLHGVLASSSQHNRSSGLLREATGATVVALDLRGHGGSGGRPGDSDFIGQYERDVAEVVAELRAEQPGGRLVLAGHSMGGGIGLRYAQLAGAPPVDGLLLFAPHLGARSSTTRQQSTPGEAAFVRLHLPRLLGCSVFNLVGIRAFNGLHTLFFNLPPEMPLRSYTYRALLSMTPADHRRALAAVHAPLLVVAGSADEAFVAAHYATEIQVAEHARLVLVPGANHNGILVDPTALAAVHDWLAHVEGR